MTKKNLNSCMLDYYPSLSTSNLNLFFPVPTQPHLCIILWDWKLNKPNAASSKTKLTHPPWSSDSNALKFWKCLFFSFPSISLSFLSGSTFNFRFFLCALQQVSLSLVFIYFYFLFLFFWNFSLCNVNVLCVRCICDTTA